MAEIRFLNYLNLVRRTNHYSQPLLLKPCKVVCFRTGSGQAMIGSSVCGFTGGMFAVINPGQIFEDIVTTQTEELICEFSTAHTSLPLRSGLYRDADGAVLRLLEKIQEESRGAELYRSELLDLLAAELYFTVLRRRCSDETKSVEDIVRYLDDHFDEDVRIESLAQMTGYTSRHFRSLFTEKAGLPPSEYLLKKRLDHSEELLLATRQSIAEISQVCGFSSSSRFSLLFRRWAGKTPSEFRSSHVGAEKMA